MASELLELHRRLVETPSLSGREGEIADFVESWLERRGANVRRLGDNVVARAGAGPRLLLCSHLDTVSATESWRRDPWRASREGDRIYGLGSNDAKASAAAMTAAFLNVVRDGGPCEITLLLVPQEETGGDGAEVSWPALLAEGWVPAGAVVGEPTGLDVATAQKGLLILELIAEGDSCHSANAAALGARNAVRALARDLVRLEDVDLGPEHPTLGRTTLEPTLTRAGERKNMIPDLASSWLDLRTVPGVSHQELIDRLRATLAGRVEIYSDRLRPCECPAGAAIVDAAVAARPDASIFGSRTMSDMVWLREVPAIKCGPGRSERSHTADEYVLASELEEGYDFYRRLIKEFARLAEGPAGR